ncbi:uncharacterized protein [Epargyreus clarus]|uniref:uncharacterized protein n=1 Tax=Epargyreus clarus TaxID=520877 RepID=UPI003C2C81C9
MDLFVIAREYLIVIYFITVLAKKKPVPVLDLELDTNRTDTEKVNNNSHLFEWLEFDNRFDCIVGITVDDKPVGIGILIYEDFIITSANPLEQYLEKKDNNEYTDPKNKVKIHAIHDAFNKSKVLNVGVITGNIAKRNDVWIRMGFNKTHSPIHDLMLIKIPEGQVKKPPATNQREAFYLTPDFDSYFTSGWTFAGFGYSDNYHIAENIALENTLYEDSDVADCDEWIPRAWGRFVCLSNVENLEGVQSGAPLFHEGGLRGVGSFALRKGKESILVFTDYHLYTLFSVHKSSLSDTLDMENNTLDMET